MFVMSTVQSEAGANAVKGPTTRDHDAVADRLPRKKFTRPINCVPCVLAHACLKVPDTMRSSIASRSKNVRSI